MVGTIRPLRFLQRQKSLLTNFVRRHRKALLIVGIIAASYFTVNIASAVAFNQKAETDGVRLETDKAVFLVGERVAMRIFLVNKLDSPISVCTNNYDVTLTGVLGASRRSISSTPGGPCEKSLLPGGEALVATEVLEAYTPGPHTAEVSVYTSPDLGVRFTGKINILVVMWPYP